MKLSLSDQAWENLAMDAGALGWIRSMNTVNVLGPTTRNIHRYFAALSIVPVSAYIDRRPDELGGTCVWHDGELARQHKLGAHQDTVERLALLACAFRIPPRWYATLVFKERAHDELTDAEYARVISTRQTTPHSLASVALEAIGMRWLIPMLGYPKPPADLFTRAPRGGQSATELTIARKYGL